MNSLQPDPRQATHGSSSRAGEWKIARNLHSVWRALFALLLIAITCLSWGEAGAVAPGEDLSVAGLVVDYGDGAISYALIPFASDDVSGLDLLEMSGLDVFSIEVGGMGTAVCAIQQVGCDYDACRGRLCQTGEPDSPYWQYLRGTQEQGGDWRYASRGASSSRLTNGDVDGWYWSSNRPNTPALTLDEIAEKMGVSLDALRGTTSPEPMVLTVGSVTPTATKSEVEYWEVAGGVAVFIGVGAVGWYAVRQVNPNRPSK